jgi:hypothetical protein
MKSKIKKTKIVKASKILSYVIIKKELEAVEDISSKTWYCMLVLVISKLDGSKKELVLGHKKKEIRDKFVKEHTDPYQSLEKLQTILYQNGFKEWCNDDLE